MKYLKKLLLVIALYFTCLLTVNAATGSITASTSSKTVSVGSTFTVTVKVSCSEALGSWQFGVSYDSSNISLQSGDTQIAAYGDGSTKSKSYTYKFKAIKSGSASVKVTGASMVSWNDVNTLFTPSTSSTSVTIKTQAEIEASYSKDNNLKLITVDGFELTPSFDKNTTDYSVEVPDTTTSIKVSAKVNDSTARVSGTGDIDLSEGTNKVELTVTAQNGSVKTYTVVINVKDLNPINVTVDSVNYTVVKKADLLTCPTGFTETTLTINEIEVPAFKSELASLVVLGLKDETGNISMFIYDETKNTYAKYNELKGNSLILLPVQIEDEPSGFTKKTLKINEQEYDVFVNDKDDDLILLYAMNIENGKKNYFVYDKDNNAFIKYNGDLLEALSSENNEFKMFSILLGASTGILLLLCIALASKNSKLKKLALKITSSALKSEKSDDLEQTLAVEESEILDEPIEEESESHDEITFEKPKNKKHKKR